jgi:hypothetical protein
MEREYWSKDPSTHNLGYFQVTNDGVRNLFTGYLTSECEDDLYTVKTMWVHVETSQLVSF